MMMEAALLSAAPMVLLRIAAAAAVPRPRRCHGCCSRAAGCHTAALPPGPPPGAPVPLLALPAPMAAAALGESRAARASASWAGPRESSHCIRRSARSGWVRRSQQAGASPAASAPRPCQRTCRVVDRRSASLVGVLNRRLSPRPGPPLRALPPPLAGEPLSPPSVARRWRALEAPLPPRLPPVGLSRPPSAVAPAGRAAGEPSSHRTGAQGLGPRAGPALRADSQAWLPHLLGHPKAGGRAPQRRSRPEGSPSSLQGARHRGASNGVGGREEAGAAAARCSLMWPSLPPACAHLRAS